MKLNTTCTLIAYHLHYARFNHSCDSLLFYLIWYMGDFANYWQAFIPHSFRFDYHFVSVYYYLKEHDVNFFRFFLCVLNYFIHPSNYWVFKNTYLQSFLLRLWISKENVKTYLYVQKSQLFEKNTIFPIAMQNRSTQNRSTQNRKLTLKMCVLRDFRHFDSQFSIFFEKLRLFYISHVIFRLGFARVHNDFF